jgi:hypothetical protein
MNIEHISVSRSKSYKQCSWYYKLKYHEKIANPGPEQWYFTFGKIVHKCAEVYTIEKGKRSMSEIMTDVTRGKIELEPGKIDPATGLPGPGKKAPPKHPDYATRLPTHLRNVQKITHQLGFEGHNEYKFTYDLDPPHGRNILGFIDRVIIKDDKAWILDYKTTKKGPFRETKESIIRDPQLRIYARVVNRNFGIAPENIKCALYYVDGGDLIGSQYSMESLLGIEQELLEVYKEIENKPVEAARGKIGPHCTRCEYNSLCTFYLNSAYGKNGGSSASEAWDGDLSKIRTSLL